MELTLNNNFIDLSSLQLEMVNGGSGWKSVFFGVAGSVLVANSLAIAVVCPPAGITALGTGLYFLGSM